MVKKKEAYAVGIVTYNPDVNRLKDNLEAVLENDSIDIVVIVDNNSKNRHDILELVNDNANIMFIPLDDNKGIAYALNTICLQAQARGDKWVLTLDQDSIPQPHMADELLAFVEEGIGILCPRTEDRNMGRQYTTSTQGCDKIDYVITSGNLVNVKAWEQVGKFDESLFIDGVDFDFCLRLHQFDYTIARINHLYILHEVGHGKSIKILNRQISIMNHAPLRLYYIARNYLYIGRKYNKMKHWATEVAKRILIVLFFERNRLEKMRYIMRGIKDFKLRNMGKYNKQ